VGGAYLKQFSMIPLTAHTKIDEVAEPAIGDADKFSARTPYDAQ